MAWYYWFVTRGADPSQSSAYFYYYYSAPWTAVPQTVAPAHVFYTPQPALPWPVTGLIQTSG